MDVNLDSPEGREALIKQLLAAIERDILPLQPADNYPRRRGLFNPFSETMLWGVGREKYVIKYGHVLLSRECVDALIRVIGDQRVLDVCAGGGFLAHTLANEGVSIEAVDLYPPPLEPDGLDPRVRWKVDIEGSALDQPLGDYGVLLMVWPDHGAPFSDQVAAAMRPGQILIYEGESRGACTACDAFFDRVNGPDWKFMEDETAALNKHHVGFHGMNDYWAVLQKLR